eukprot:Plantae.Rhodophyta-Palmaria_palmata.ctg25715.p1 GENE.Plantae.Rhodophyta-Palmaria_palmata.ctg25715~~Plantae.Rhodophyta-Palmaria_palmata.ctg25715.p1  ORF type:complete len:115 (-),score=11.78 Plantae.Rhodophyta-Palmaria_palmata.ctg25715:55-399(-)
MGKHQKTVDGHVGIASRYVEWFMAAICHRCKRWRNEASAESPPKTVVRTLGLPPAVLRDQPLLMAMSEDRICGGFDDLKRDLSATQDAQIRRACKDKPRLLTEAGTQWTEALLP